MYDKILCDLEYKAWRFYFDSHVLGTDEAVPSASDFVQRSWEGAHLHWNEPGQVCARVRGWEVVLNEALVHKPTLGQSMQVENAQAQAGCVSWEPKQELWLLSAQFTQHWRQTPELL